MADIAPQTTKLQAAEQKFKKAYGELKTRQQNLEQVSEWLGERFYWVQVCQELRGCLLRTEELTRRKLGADTGVWIEKINMLTPGEALAPAAAPVGATAIGMGPGGMAGPEAELFRKRYGLNPSAVESAPPPPPPNPDGSPAAGGGAAGTISTNEVGTVNVIFRSVNIEGVPSAQSDIAYALQAELRNSAWFDPTNTTLTGEIRTEDTTFTFGATLKLQKPLKL